MPATAPKLAKKPATRRPTAAPKPAKKPASRKLTAAPKPTTSKPTAKKPTPASRPAKPPSAATKARAQRDAADQAERAKRAVAATNRIVKWIREHSDDERLGTPSPGATPASLAAYERALGVPLPLDLRAFWTLHDGGVSIFEYEGLGSRASLERRSGMEELRQSGVLADHEIFPQDVPRIAATKWHPRWIPLAEDGCGNLYCVDMGPGRMGVVGQVIRWEMRGGAYAASSVVLAELLERYAAALESGKFTLHDSMFDGPYLDLLEPGPHSRPVRRR